MAEHHQQYHQHRRQQEDDGTSFKSHFHENGPSSSKVLAVATLVPVGGTLLFLAGISLIGTLIGLAVATPIFIICSPVLVPAALFIAGSIAGFLTSGAFGIIGLSSISWIANQLRGMRMQGAGSSMTMSAQQRTQDAAEYVGKKVKDVGQKIQNKSQEEGGTGTGTGTGSGTGTGTGRDQEAVVKSTREGKKK